MAGNRARYIRIFFLAARMQALRLLTKRFALVAYGAGKLLRMGFFLVFGLALFKNSSSIAGFSRGELLVCYAMMNAVDVVTQMIFLRGLTQLQMLIKKGTLDQLLVKPVSPLFWLSVSLFDWIDFVTLPGVIAYLWYAVRALEYAPSAANIAFACGLGVVGIAIAYGIMLSIAAVSFYVEDAENMWWLYRDFIYSSRNPPAFFPHGVQSVFTFIIPIFTIVSFPALGLVGRLSGWLALWACVAAVLFVTLGVLLWRRGLRMYSSASS